ncbi:MAG: HD domain-containing protein, partial [Chloroflexi bacterium]|nr:HD domain-containing protein [Chloroflexota bacterium]
SHSRGAARLYRKSYAENEIKEHPLMSVSILDPIEEFDGIVNFVRHHHERFDGKGYPDGLKGKDTLIGTRILKLADSYDAMNSDRPYRNALKKDELIAELIASKGTQFDPRLVDILVKLIKQEEI